MVANETIRDVPNWLVWNLTQPRGKRLKKRELLTIPKPEERRAAEYTPPLFPLVVAAAAAIDRLYSQGPSTTPQSVSHVRARSAIRPFEFGGNLLTAEYRFWTGCSWAMSPFAQCRACRQNVYNDVDRETHKETTLYKTMSCNWWLVQAYKLMLTQYKVWYCVCCGKQTMKKPWGVPICSGDCLKQWKFMTVPWPRLKHALREVGFGL